MKKSLQILLTKRKVYNHKKKAIENAFSFTIAIDLINDDID